MISHTSPQTPGINFADQIKWIFIQHISQIPEPSARVIGSASIIV